MVASPRSMQALETYQTLLTAARKRFAQHGYHGATTRSIADSAGVTQPLVMHYFGSKTKLFATIVARAVGDIELALKKMISPQEDCLDFFISAMDSCFSLMDQEPEAIRLMAWARLEGDASLTEHTLSLPKKFLPKMEEAREQGIFRQDIDLEASVLVIDACLKGYWDRKQLYQTCLAAPQNLDRRYREESLRVLLLSLVTPEYIEVCQTKLKTYFNSVINSLQDSAGPETTGGTDSQHGELLLSQL